MFLSVIILIGENLGFSYAVYNFCYWLFLFILGITGRTEFPWQNHQSKLNEFLLFEKFLAHFKGYCCFIWKYYKGKYEKQVVQ